MRNIVRIAAVIGLVAAAGTSALSQDVDQAKIDAIVAAAFPNLPPELQKRVDQDQTQAECSKYRDNPPADVADAIVAREMASIVYPADGNLMGDWQVALKEANNGYGWRMRDKAERVVGGNCYACHQLAPDEVAYGNLGPSLTGYGKDRTIDAEIIKATYDKIYNPQAVLACSQMPRLGHNGYLTPEQIRDYVAMLLHPDSPVNK
ncbi:MAG: sulfur oxidation c-type cytochrome SoxX [Rhizobiales bacterium]|nr:sulfur oxidation c-type cytochrome SoxX [Hyphomicrobiales bacterium]